ncbi:MAG TPA: T9SS type A sorting domain-containing protein [Bacteroidales bacterium]|nr:T9SS type A sorting domain-containing protein [Bacteroidales bacterium]
MKKTSMLFFAVLLSAVAYAQPVINKLYDFQPGDSYTFKKLAPGGSIDYNSIETAGANLTWDLSFLQLEENPYTDTIIAYENSDWPNSFPGCSFVWKEYSGTEQYYRKNGDSLLYMGNAVWAPSKFEPNPPTIVYPGNYTASGYMYSGFQSFLNSSAQWTFEARYNAYGTLILPGNINVPNVALYSSYGGPLNSGYSDFMWVRENESLPIMRIQFYHSGSSITVQYCYVLHAALTGIETKEETLVHTRVYPNPAKDFIYIESEQELSETKLTDLSGRILYQTKGSGNKVVIPAGDLTEGIYMVKFSDRNGRSAVTRIVH